MQPDSTSTPEQTSSNDAGALALGADYVRNPDLRILATIAGLAGRYATVWVKPSQRKILELMARRYRRTMTRRTLCRHLGAFELQGYFRRIRRHRRGPTGSLELHSTVYVLKHRALRLFAQLHPFLRRALEQMTHNLGITAVTKMAQSNPILVDIMVGGILNPMPPPT